MARSSWKIPFSNKSIFNTFYFSRYNKKLIFLWQKDSVIFPTFVDKNVYVYNGKVFVNLQIKRDMVGHKFGEFILTRKKVIHKKK